MYYHGLDELLGGYVITNLASQYHSRSEDRILVMEWFLC
jgi:hypothetical protein